MLQGALTWSTRFLSLAGKATILHVVLSAIPTFAMTCFELQLVYANESNPTGREENLLSLLGYTHLTEEAGRIGLS